MDRADAGHFREAQRVFRVSWDPSRPALDSLLAHNQLNGRQLDRLRRDSHNQQYAIRAQAADQRRHRFAAGRGCKNRTRAAESLQLGRGIRGGAVDIEIRAKLFCKRSVVGPTAYCRDPIAKFLCELNSQVAKPANPLDGDKIAW